MNEAIRRIRSLTLRMRRTDSRGVRLASSRVAGVFLASALLAAGASAQSSAATTPFGREMEKVDLGISGIGLFNQSSSGTNYLPQNIAQTPSNTFGGLVQLRYTRSPLVGVEFTYTYARFDETFNVTSTTGTPVSQKPYVLGVQSKVNEYSMGYVAHGPTLFGLQTFAGGGLGAIEFKPTSGGGQGLPPEVRTGFYYDVGVQQSVLNDHFGIRAQFRQVFYGSPDFNENYLASGGRTTSFEPGIGFYLRF